MGLFGTKYSSFEFSRYAITLVGRCEDSPEGNLILELQPGVFAICFGTPKRNQFIRFRNQYQAWASGVIQQYCTSGFAGYPEEVLDAVFAIEHGCAVAVHEYREQPQGYHVTGSSSRGLPAMAADLQAQAVHGRWRP